MDPSTVAPNTALETLRQSLGERASLLQGLPHQLVTIESVPTYGPFPVGESGSYIPTRICVGSITKKRGDVWIYIERRTCTLMFHGFSNDDDDDDYGSFLAEEVVKHTNLERPFHLATNGIKLTALAYYYCIKLGISGMQYFNSSKHMVDALRSICDELERGNGRSLIVRLPYRFDLINLNRVTVQATASNVEDIQSTISVAPTVLGLGGLSDSYESPSTSSATSPLFNYIVSPNISNAV